MTPIIISNLNEIETWYLPSEDGFMYDEFFMRFPWDMEDYEKTIL